MWSRGWQLCPGQGGWNFMIFKVLSNLSHSAFLFLVKLLVTKQAFKFESVHLLIRCTCSTKLVITDKERFFRGYQRKDLAKYPLYVSLPCAQWYVVALQNVLFITGCKSCVLTSGCCLISLMLSSLTSFNVWVCFSNLGSAAVKI